MFFQQKLQEIVSLTTTSTDMKEKKRKKRKRLEKYGDNHQKLTFSFYVVAKHDALTD